MAGYHSGISDDFSPKKYATVSALKEMEYHSNDDKEEDPMYHNQKLYGNKDDDNPFGSDYHRKDENEDLFGTKAKEKELFGLDKNVAEEMKETYKPKTNDEIAGVLFKSPGLGPGEEGHGSESQSSAKKPEGLSHETVPKKKSVEEIINDLPWKKSS